MWRNKDIFKPFLMQKEERGAKEQFEGLLESLKKEKNCGAVSKLSSIH